jgi:predicted nucleic acid-binding protein
MLFLDSSAIFAWFNSRDGNHKRASKFMEAFRGGDTEFKNLITTDVILVEVVDLTQIKLGKAEALRLGNILNKSGVLEIIDTSKQDRMAALEIMEKFKDLDSNLTDAISFAVMKRLGIGNAFTFDGHFKIHRFKMVP